MKVLVTGGSGFIGKNLIKNLLRRKNYQVFNIDKNCDEVKEFLCIEDSNYLRYKFFKCDLSIKSQINDILFETIPDLIIMSYY